MKTKLLGLIAASLLFIASPAAHALTYDINLNTATGVPGTGGTGDVTFLCYCETTIYYSPVFLVQPGTTVDFGQVTLYSFQSGQTPDAGPNQPNLYVLSNVAVSLNPPVVPVRSEDLYLNAPYPNPTYTVCDQADTSCNASAANAMALIDLIYGVPNGASSIQLAWAGSYAYVAPTPLPAALPLFATGLGVMGLFGWRRKRKNNAAIAAA